MAVHGRRAFSGRPGCRPTAQHCATLAELARLSSWRHASLPFPRDISSEKGSCQAGPLLESSTRNRPPGTGDRVCTPTLCPAQGQALAALSRLDPSHASEGRPRPPFDRIKRLRLREVQIPARRCTAGNRGWSRDVRLSLCSVSVFLGP